MYEEIGVFYSVFCLLGVNHVHGSLLYTLELIDEDRDAWVAAHNHYRRLVDTPEAADMRLMTWNTGLEEFAKSVVQTCNFYHTASADLVTDEFERVGENLYAGGEYNFPQILETDGVTKQWFDERNFYDYEDSSCSGPECGHYTQLIWAETYKVGCAIARCSSVNGGNGPYLVSCNYGPAGNAYYPGGIPVKPYVAGDSCTQCDAGDTCTDQLCSNEIRDSNVTITQPVVTTTTEATVTTTTEATTTTSATPESETTSTTTETTTQSSCMDGLCDSGGVKNTIGTLHWFLAIWIASRF